MSWILTHTGKHFDFLNPMPDMIDIMDIARGLSREARFAGQTKKMYTVAQHSVGCSHLVSRDYRLEALLHDAAEAYCKDIPSPLKHLLPDYKRIHERVDAAIRIRFNLPLEMSIDVHKADLTMLATEKRDLMPADKIAWPMLVDVTPMSRTIYPYHPDRAYDLFCSRWMEVMHD